MGSFCLANCGKKEAAEGVALEVEAAKDALNTNEILSMLKQNADLVTTEVSIRKIGIYDSSKHEKFSWTKFSSWKVGDRKCIVPVEVTIKYGYDLRDLTTDNIKLTDDSTAIIIELPKAKIIDAGYNLMIDEGSVVSLSTGLRDKIGHEVEEAIRKKGYEAVMKEDVMSMVANDVEQNAKTVFESIVRNAGIKDVEVVVITKK